MLVNIWSEPYGRSASSPGIPYLTKPEKHAFVDYKRGTVEEVYTLIEQDLKRGISLVSDRYYQLARSTTSLSEQPMPSPPASTS